METQLFSDAITFADGFRANLPVDTPQELNAIGDGENLTFNQWARAVGWEGISRRHGVAGELMFVADDKFAALESGSLIVGLGKSLWTVGTGAVKWDNPSTTIGTASSSLSIYTNGQFFQGGLNAPPKPTLSQATDSAGGNVTGTMTGDYQASLTRIRSITGAESAESDGSAIVPLTNGKLRLVFPRALSEVAQDQWGVYFTKSNLAGVRYRLRIVNESELAADAGGTVGDAAGDGATVNYSLTSNAAVSARLAGLALASAGVTPPPYRAGRSYVATNSTFISVAYPDGLFAGDFLLATLLVKQSQQIAENATNSGARAFSLTGAWVDGGALQPGTEQIQVEILSTNSYRFKRTSDAGWTTAAMSASASLLGVSGLSIKWTGAAVASEQVGNVYYITPFALNSAPAGFTLRTSRWSVDDEYVMLVYSADISTTSGTARWDFSSACTVKADLVAYSGVSSIAQTATAETSATTTHAVVFPVAPAATQRVVLFVELTAEATLSAVAPITLQLQPGASTRYLDFDFNDGDLGSDVAPSADLEPPPAATHLAQLGAILCLLGTEDGTGITPSVVGQWEQFRVTNTTFLNPAEQILRVDVRAINGQVFIWTENSVQTLILTSNEDEPVLPQAIEGARGISNKNAAAVGDNVAYAFKRHQAYRILNGVETAFADPVSAIFKGWNDEDVVVGYDPKQRVAVYCYGRDIYAFHEDLEVWTTRQDIGAYIDWPLQSDRTDARIVSAVTKEGSLFLSVGSKAAGYRLYEYRRGVGGRWRAQSNNRNGGPQVTGMRKTLGLYQLSANLNTEIQVPYYYLANVDTFLDEFWGKSPSAYALSSLVIDRETLQAGGIEYEWTIHAQAGGAYILADHAALSPYAGAAAVLHTSLSALIAVRIVGGNSLQVFKAGAATGPQIAIQVGDKVRLRQTSTLEWALMVERVGTVVEVVAIGAITANTLGLKVQCSNGGRMAAGLVRRVLPGGKVRFLRNFNLARLKEKSYAAKPASAVRAGENHYQWEQINIRGCATYKVEVEGSGAGQMISHVLLKGEVEAGDRL